MKIKSDFVTNSSSVCYIIHVPLEFELPKESMDEYCRIYGVEEDHILEIIEKAKEGITIEESPDSEIIENIASEFELVLISISDEEIWGTACVTVEDISKISRNYRKLMERKKNENKVGICNE